MTIVVAVAHLLCSCHRLVTGFWNCLIYLKSKPKSVMKIRRALHRTLPCIFSRPNDFDPGVSFATGLRQNRFSNSNMSAGFSSGHIVEPFAQKQDHRDTASTAALDELKLSMNDLDHDISGFDREEKADCFGDVYVPQMTPCSDDDESPSEHLGVPPEPPTSSDTTTTATESANVHEASILNSSGIEEVDVVQAEPDSVGETTFKC
jgi:hypothetical protein